MTLRALLLHTKICCVLLCMLLVAGAVRAQLKAEFSLDKTGGCSPLSVSFTNNTTGASSSAVYEWDFGNGNKSIIKDAGAIFLDEKTYTVTLTVTDGTQRSVKTQQVTVYSKPVIDFSANVAKGCLPLNVQFTSSSSPGSGTIVQYNWDFGDGSTEQNTSSTQPHTYTLPQLATVSLTATNSFGCHSTAQKKDIVRVIPSLTASFSADKRILCRTNDPVQFTNSSAGPGTLTYAWDFGDGGTSTALNPNHIFNTRGIYTTKLTVTSSEGCVATNTQNNLINVASFTTNFTMPAAVCSDKNISFVANANPYPNSSVWEINGVPYSYYGEYLNYAFNAPGTYKVKLTNTYGTCIDSAVKQVVVKASPTSIGFMATVKGQCGAPVGVDFRDTTAGAVSWQWSLDHNNTNTVHSTQQATTYTYTENRLYHVMLRVGNSDGCTKEIFQTVNLPYPSVHIFYTSSSTNPPTSACGPITTTWSSTATWQGIAQYRWDFGDGGTSTEAEPTHTFIKPGNFQIKLNYTTTGGCTGTAFYNSVSIYEKPKAQFNSMSGTTICGNTPVVLANQSTGNVSTVNWIINGLNYGAGNLANIVHRFQDTGKYTIKLIAYSGQCSDTIEKVDYIRVLPPFVNINSVANTCDSTRGKVTFSTSSRLAQSWRWDWGDGNNTVYNAEQTSVSHVYNKTGTYKVVLTATNAGCTLKDSTFAYVLLKKDIALTVPPAICVGSNMNFTLGGLQDNPYPDVWRYNYFFTKWEYQDSTPYTGYMNNTYYIEHHPTFGGSMQQPDPAKQQMRVILQSVYFGCYDTSNFAPIKVIGPQPQLQIANTSVCFNTPVTFNDISPVSGTNIIRREWNFGDGQSQITTGGTVTHTYTNPGSYYVFLRVTDDKGCTGTTPQYVQYVSVNGPKASFYASASNVALNSTVGFYNSTNNHGDYNTAYSWDFGDGGTSTQYSPSYTFTRPGTFTVKLIATNAVTGCRSEATQVITVKNFNTAFNFNSSFITSQSCPPVLVRFNNTSVNYIRVSWDFGDGIRVDNVNYPSHIYEKPGKYIITLFGYGPNGLTGTHIDSIVIQSPKATMRADDLEGCIGNVVTLHAKADSTQSYIWDFGDGHVVTSADSFYAHTYNTPGSYSPSLLVKDVNGCAASTSITGKIVIRPNPTVSITPNDPVVCLGQGTTLTATGGQTYSWSPATGLSNSGIASPLANPLVNTTYTVEVSDDIGCKNTGTVSVKVVAPVTVAVPSNLSVCYGNSITIAAGGAILYNWINNTVGLSNTSVPNPTATPGITTTYTVTGSDAYKCFTDTAEVTVRVLPLPTVNAGTDMEVQAGTPVNLSPTYSSDVRFWTWTPSNYLSCNTCPAPVSTPLAQTVYTLTVKNDVGCTAKDSMLIKMICDEARVAIPNAFSPNGDGKNDAFIIKGISIVKHMIVYNRWGQKVFERNNFIAADRSTCWDGTLNGYPASPGTYVYFLEMECPSGGVFTRKGSFVLVR